MARKQLTRGNVAADSRAAFHQRADLESAEH
jgi:hypothetical protein